MIPAIQSASSALQAYSLKTQATANNVANLNTDGFKRDVVTLSSQAPQGVTTNVSKDTSAGTLAAEMTSTGEETMVEQSNVDLAQEMVDLITEKHGFSANVKTLQSADAMAKTIIDLKA